MAAKMGETLEDQAIHVIVENLVQRGDGKVWLDDWRGQFRNLGPTPKHFMEQRPDLFNLAYNGNRYSVELVGDAEQMAKDMGAGDVNAAAKSAASKGSKGGGVRIADYVGGPSGGSKGGKGVAAMGPLSAANNYGVIVPGAAKAKGKSTGKGSVGKGRNPALPVFPGQQKGIAEEAIAEIESQLLVGPKVWIDDWRERYAMLGPSPKQFMESRPDVFKLTYRGDRGYSVQMLERAEGSKEEPTITSDDLRAAEQQANPEPDGMADEETCIEEISNLLAQSTDGRIWIPDWFQRYAHLAKSPKAFMESRPDVFVLTFRGNTYSVSLLDREIGPAAPPKRPAKATAPTARPLKSLRLSAPAPKRQPLALTAPAASRQSHSLALTAHAVSQPDYDNTASDNASSVLTSALEYLGDKEEDALGEIFDQLSKPYSNGKVSFVDWERRFGHLAGSPRKLIEMHPDKFEIIPGHGGSFTVELV